MILPEWWNKSVTYGDAIIFGGVLVMIGFLMGFVRGFIQGFREDEVLDKDS